MKEEILNVVLCVVVFLYVTATSILIGTQDKRIEQLECMYEEVMEVINEQNN